MDAHARAAVRRARADKPLRLGLIGFGAIAQSLVQCLDASLASGDIDIVTVLVRSPRQAIGQSSTLSKTVFTTQIDHFLQHDPGLVVECAGHSAVRDTCPEILSRGFDLVVISIGALADRGVEERLRAAAEGSSGRLTLPSGAVGGLDLLASARLAGLDSVRYVSRKPPAAWKGTRAEHLIGLEKHTRAIEIFNGNARDAALQFPQNANVAAAIALSGIGFEKTEVTLNADPQARGNEHSILAEGIFGRAELHVSGNPLPQNPKTSWLAALSLARAVLNSRARVII